MSSSVQFHSIDTFDVEGDAFRLTALPKRPSRPSGGVRLLTICNSQCCVVASMISLAAVTLVMSALALFMAQATWRQQQQGSQQPSMSPSASFRPVSRIAFGSCTSHDLRPQPIWETVVAVQPDAWIWLGDMAYTDNPVIDCKQVPDSPQCNCTPSYLRSPTDECYVGDIDHIRDRFIHQVNLPEYRKFLEFMCPGSTSRPQYPAPGSDPASCPRAVLGTYDDHDSGWNNGNRRLPGKHIVKNLFLDAVGEPRDSPRRTATSGLQAAYTLNGGGGSMRGSSRDVQVVLLDERYYRDTLPCSMREDWCERTLFPFNAPLKPDANAIAWCQDFVPIGRDASPESLGKGTCCRRDELLEDWCLRGSGANNHSHPLWAAACDPTSLAYGLTPLALSDDFAAEPKVVDVSMFEGKQGELWPWLVEESPICDVLGPTQRRWLQHELASSQAPLRIIASGSVPFGSVGFRDDQGECSGDDWQCYQPAQVNLLHTLASSVNQGCVVILTGDYHYADIKLVRPGIGFGYSEALLTEGLARPVWQFMSSGMTTSTAQHASSTCEGSFLEDLVGLRPLGKCALFSDPNFGTIDVDWEAREVTLTVRDGGSGEAAVGVDGSLQEVTFSLDTCLPRR